MTYDFHILKDAILFNSQEVIPTDQAQLDKEIQILVERANTSGEQIHHYIGFEISGQIHIGTGIAPALKIKKLQKAGVVCSIFLADYHTELNGKLDGKIETIRKVAREYFAPVMLKCCEIVGCDTSKVQIVFAEDLYETKRNNQNYFTHFLKIAKNLTLNRVLKSVSIMGKDAGEGVDFGTLEYPVMQVTDAFFMQTHLVHAGMDQRKCHVLMREIAYNLDSDFQLKIDEKAMKPIAIHHNLLLGLESPTKTAVSSTVKIIDPSNTTIEVEETFTVSKMSKSRPDSAIWVHDSLSEIQRKLKKAYCPMIDPNLDESGNRVVQSLNPILDWCKNMIYPGGQTVTVMRPDKFGGNKSYNTFDELESDYFAGSLHPMDLKNGVSQSLADWFAPIKDYTDNNPEGLGLVVKARK